MSAPIDFMLSAATRVAVHGLAATSGPGLSILIFHRVLSAVDPLFPTEMDSARFDRLMALVSRSFRVLRLADAVERLERGRLPPNALSITFDDGYADNHNVALPILQRHRLPACFFIATGFLDGGRMFNDTVIECVRGSTLRRVDLGDFGLDAFELDTPAQRAALIARVLQHIKFRPPAERQEALDRLRAICRPATLPDDLMMTRAQVQALHTAGMEIGAHTVTHPILCNVGDGIAEQEIVTGREVLQALIDEPVSLFAYPNGLPGRDFALQHAQLVKRLGFAAAVTTAEGVPTTGADRFQLPRVKLWGHSPLSWMSWLVATRRHRRYATALAQDA